MGNDYSREELEEMLVTRYDYIIKFLAVKGASADLCEELAQQTIYEGYRHLEQLRNPDKMNSWLATIAVRLFVKEIERNKNVVSIDEDNGVLNILASDFDVAEDIIRREENLKLRKYISELGKKACQVITLHYLDSFTLREISKTLEENYNTVRSLNIRALGKLRLMLKKDRKHLQ